MELLELIGRIADLKFKNSDMDILPLYKRMEFILDDLLELVEMKRKDIHIVVDDQSESDDEYWLNLNIDKEFISLINVWD